MSSESEEVGFVQGLIRPSASSTLTRHPQAKVLDGPTSCRLVGPPNGGAGSSRAGITYFDLVDGISGVGSYDHPLH